MCKAEEASDKKAEIVAGLRNALRQQLVLHLASMAVGFVPALVFVQRVRQSFTDALIALPLSLFGLVYYPMLAVCTSLALATFSFLMHQVAAIERLLLRACQVAARALGLGRTQDSASTRSIKLAELQDNLDASAESALGLRDENAQFPSPALVLARLALRVVLIVLRRVLASRFRSLAGELKVIRAEISARDAVALLESGVVGAVVGPFRNTLRVYFAITLAASFVLLYIPLRAVG